MVVFDFTEQSIKIFRILPFDIRSRVERKLKDLKQHPHIFSLLISMKNHSPVTHRLRVGSYRILLQYLPEESTFTSTKFLVHDIGHRKDIYS